MSLPWVRLDSNIASHDKVLRAVGDRGKPAMAVYMFGLGWSGGHLTDGHIPAAALLGHPEQCTTCGARFVKGGLYRHLRCRSAHPGCPEHIDTQHRRLLRGLA